LWCLQAHRHTRPRIFESAPEVPPLAFAPPGITLPSTLYYPVRLPPWAAASRRLRPLPSPLTGLPRLPEPPFRRACPLPRRSSGARVYCFPTLQPSPNGMRSASWHWSTFEPVMLHTCLRPTGSLTAQGTLSRGFSALPLTPGRTPSATSIDNSRVESSPTSGSAPSCGTATPDI